MLLYSWGGDPATACSSMTSRAMGQSTGEKEDLESGPHTRSIIGFLVTFQHHHADKAGVEYRAGTSSITGSFSAHVDAYFVDNVMVEVLVLCRQVLGAGLMRCS